MTNNVRKNSDQIEKAGKDVKLLQPCKRSATSRNAKQKRYRGRDADTYSGLL